MSSSPITIDLEQAERGVVVAVAGGFANWNKVQKIVNHKDQD